MNTVTVRNITIGDGIPKICAPIVGITRAAILEEARAINELQADMVEWRADWFADVFEFNKVHNVLQELRGILGDTPVLMTFRTSKEGGEKAIDAEAYVELNIRAAETGLIDLVDAEAFTGSEIAKQIINGAHNAGVKVIASNHDFSKTPERDVIVSRLRNMQELGADILKIAYMPNSKRDVLTLLAASEEMASEYADKPIIAISMGRLGVISRIAGEAFGSAVTFGATNKVSAPGQIEISELKKLLSLMHDAL